VLPMGTNYAMGAPMIAAGNRKKKTLPEPSEKIVAMEYRQIRLFVKKSSRNGGNESESIEGELMKSVKNEDIEEVLGMAIDDGKGSIIVTPLED